MSRPFSLGLAFVVALSCFTGCSAATNTGGDPFAAVDFPVMSWEVRDRSDRFSDQTNGLQSLIDCGYNVAGFVTANQLPLCEKLHIKAIVRGDDAPVEWMEKTDEQIDAYYKDLIAKTKNSTAVIGYFITDEPGVQKFPKLAKAVAAVKKYAPGKIAYINLYPNYATLGAPNLSQLGTKNYEEYLEKYVTEVEPQFVSWDNYRIETSLDLKKATQAESYFTNLLAARKVAFKHNIPFWQITESNQIRPFSTPPSPANLLMHAYTTLAAGGQGVTWYTYYGGNAYGYAPIDKDNHRTATWSYLRMVNDQVRVIGPMMRKLKSTGVYFSSPAPAANLPVLPGEVTQSAQCETPLMIGEFTGSSNAKYVMVVNLSLQQSAKVKLETKQKPAGYISPVDGSLIPLDKDDSLWLVAGGGALIELK